MPAWNPNNLKRHHQKRITEDAGCFEDLMNITGRTMTVEEYAARTHHAYRTAWAEFEAEFKDIGAGQAKYHPSSAYFVDSDLVVAVTDESHREYRTCFHEHFNQSHRAIVNEPAGNRQLRFKDQLESDLQGKMIRKLKRIRGV